MGPILNGFFMAFIWGDPKQLLTGMILQVRITSNLAFGASELKRHLIKEEFFRVFFWNATYHKVGPGSAYKWSEMGPL